MDGVFLVFYTDGHHGEFACVGVLHHWDNGVLNNGLADRTEKVRNTTRGENGGSVLNIYLFVTFFGGGWFGGLGVHASATIFLSIF